MTYVYFTFILRSRLRKMNKEIRASEESKEQRLKEKCEQLKETEKSRTKRLSKYKYQDENITFQLSEDLAGSLRAMRVCIHWHLDAQYTK